MVYHGIYDKQVWKVIVFHITALHSHYQMIKEFYKTAWRNIRKYLPSEILLHHDVVEFSSR